MENGGINELSRIVEISRAGTPKSAFLKSFLIPNKRNF